MYEYLLLVQDPTVYDVPEEGENPNAFSYIHVATLATGTVLDMLAAEDPVLVDGDTIVGKWDNAGNALAPVDTTTINELLITGNYPTGELASPPDIHHFMGWTRRKYGAVDNPTQGDFPDDANPVGIEAKRSGAQVIVAVNKYPTARDMTQRKVKFEIYPRQGEMVTTEELPFDSQLKVQIPDELVPAEPSAMVIFVLGPNGEDEGLLTMAVQHEVKGGLSWTFRQAGDEAAVFPYTWYLNDGDSITPGLQVPLGANRIKDDQGVTMDPAGVDFDVVQTATLANGLQFRVEFTIPAGSNNFEVTDVTAVGWNVPTGVLDTTGTETLVATKASTTMVLLDSTAIGSEITEVVWTYS